MMLFQKTFLTILALSCTYLIWGSTYLAIYFGIQSFPPLMLGAIRFTVAGSVLYIILRLFGASRPSRSQWGGATIVGLLLPAIGNGTVCYVQQTVSSSVVALAIATAPIWMAMFSALWGHKITQRECVGIVVGFVGIVLLNMGGALHGDVANATLLILAAASWSFGSVWSKHLAMPSGLMAPACQMLAGGVILIFASLLVGEQLPQQVSTQSWLAMGFLVLFGSLVAYSAYQWLINHVRPLIAISNTFVNPIVAFMMGISFANDVVTYNEYIALVVIFIGVILVLTAKQDAQNMND